MHIVSLPTHVVPLELVCQGQRTLRPTPRPPPLPAAPEQVQEQEQEWEWELLPTVREESRPAVLPTPPTANT
jgi:hypothetical protein